MSEKRFIHADIYADHAALLEENKRLRDGLERQRQGLRNILEFRKLDSEKWGQRDGYGGRYGALTRQELEESIANIDAILAPATQEAPRPIEVGCTVRHKKQGWTAEVESVLLPGPPREYTALLDNGQAWCFSQLERIEPADSGSRG